MRLPQRFWCSNMEVDITDNSDFFPFFNRVHNLSHKQYFGLPFPTLLHEFFPDGVKFQGYPMKKLLERPPTTHQRQNTERAMRYEFPFDDLVQNPDFADMFDKDKSVRLLNSVIKRMTSVSDFFRQDIIGKHVRMKLNEADEDDDKYHEGLVKYFEFGMRNESGNRLLYNVYHVYFDNEEVHKFKSQDLMSHFIEDNETNPSDEEQSNESGTVARGRGSVPLADEQIEATYPLQMTKGGNGLHLVEGSVVDGKSATEDLQH